MYIWLRGTHTHTQSSPSHFPWCNMHDTKRQQIRVDVDHNWVARENHRQYNDDLQTKHYFIMLSFGFSTSKKKHPKVGRNIRLDSFTILRSSQGFCCLGNSPFPQCFIRPEELKTAKRMLKRSNLTAIHLVIAGSTTSTLLHEKIHPKDWQVFSLGDV